VVVCLKSTNQIINLNYIYMIITELCKAYPLLTVFSLFISYFITFKFDVLTFAFFLIFSDTLNYVLKHYIMKPIMGKRKWPILGIGTRPKGAKNPHLPGANTYGMPSGHSQNAVLFSTYIIGNLIDTNINYLIKTSGILIFSVIPIVVMYSRVHFKHHTIQQVIMGGLFGAVLGALYLQP
jgi:membrane-associated phospholipid phosphatase